MKIMKVVIKCVEKQGISSSIFNLLRLRILLSSEIDSDLTIKLKINNSSLFLVYQFIGSKKVF